MKYLPIILLSIFLFSSCIPLSIAPQIKEDKIKLAKRFKRHLPKQYALIFNDPKEADEFYHFVNSKYQLNHEEVEDNVPFKIDNKEFSFSFYEVDKVTRTINILPIILDAVISDGEDPIFEDLYSSRRGNWYIVLLANDAQMNDGLNPNYKDHEKVIGYLRDLRVEYLNTTNYFEAMLKKKGLDDIQTID